MVLPSPRTPAGMPSGRPWSSGVEIGEYRGGGSGAAARAASATAGAAERNLRWRQLAEGENVEINGRDPRCSPDSRRSPGPPKPPQSTQSRP